MTAASTASTFAFPVEAGKIREVADALHNPAEHFRSAEAARAQGHPAIPAPVIFTRSTWFHGPEQSSLSSQLKFDASLSRHAGQEWEIHKPLYAGKTYEVSTWRIVDDVTKQSRSGGTLRFITAEREFRDGQNVVMAERTTNVFVGQSGGGGAAPSAEAQSKLPEAEPIKSWHQESKTFAADWRKARPGERLAEVAIGPIGLTDIVRFAGAVGDFTPIHHDPVGARRAGLADIIAMGTFTMGLTLAVIERGYGLSGIKSAKFRFQEPLYVNRAITITLDADADSRADAPSAILSVRDSQGAALLSGSVTAR